jgi:hypothetical protein
MAFIQIIDFHTSRLEEGRPIIEEYFAKTQGRRTVLRSVLCQDRNDSTHYVNIVYFDSYESAMQNSSLPETAELAAKLGALADSPETFYDLDVLEDREG